MKSMLIRISLFLLTFYSGMMMASPIQSMQKVGEAKLEFLFWDIYDSTLYSESGVFVQEEYPLALQIKYLRDIDASDLVDKTAEEWIKLGYSDEQITPWLTEISKIWPNIAKGDELLLVVEEDKSSRFYHNRELIGDLQDVSFGPSFLAIWLDENCSYPKLRKKLIGQK